MRYALALALILGCSPTAPTDDGADAALDVAPDVVAADAGTPDAGPDAGECPYNFLRCDGVCVFAGNENCGRCGNVCTGALRCCIDSTRSRCSFNCDQ